MAPLIPKIESILETSNISQQHLNSALHVLLERAVAAPNNPLRLQLHLLHLGVVALGHLGA